MKILEFIQRGKFDLRDEYQQLNPDGRRLLIHAITASNNYKHPNHVRNIINGNQSTSVKVRDEILDLVKRLKKDYSNNK